jgi:hypothetical protein
MTTLASRDFANERNVSVSSRNISPAERIDRRAAQGDGGDSIRNVQSQAFDGAAPGAGCKFKMIIYQLFEYQAREQRRAGGAFSLTAAPAPRKMTTCHS